MVNLDNVSVVDADLLGEIITRLDPATMVDVCAALAVAVDCDGTQASTAL